MCFQGSGSDPSQPGGSDAAGSRQLVRHRITRVNLKDLLFCLENERETSRSQLLYKGFLKWPLPRPEAAAARTRSAASFSFYRPRKNKSHEYPKNLILPNLLSPVFNARGFIFIFIETNLDEPSSSAELPSWQIKPYGLERVHRLRYRRPPSGSLQTCASMLRLGLDFGNGKWRFTVVCTAAFSLATATATIPSFRFRFKHIHKDTHVLYIPVHRPWSTPHWSRVEIWRCRIRFKGTVPSFALNNNRSKVISVSRSFLGTHRFLKSAEHLVSNWRRALCLRISKIQE